MSKIEEKVIKQKERRICIKNIMQDEGFYSVQGLKDTLKKEYDIDVSRETLYSDLANIDAFDETELQAFNNKLIGNCEAHLENLNKMSINAKYEVHRVKAIDSYFKNVKDIKKILGLLTKKPVSVPEKVEVDEDDEEDVSVEFGE